MESMRTVERDGRKLFCFIEICASLFPTFSKSTVRSWVKQLKITCVTCTQEERSLFKRNNGFLNGSFGLIYESDVRRLLSYRGEKSLNSSLPSNPPQNTHSSPTKQVTFAQPIDDVSPIKNIASSPKKQVVTSPTMTVSQPSSPRNSSQPIFLNINDVSPIENIASSPKKQVVTSPTVTVSQPSSARNNSQPIVLNIDDDSPIENITSSPKKQMATSPPKMTISQPSYNHSNPPIITSERPPSLDRNDPVFTSQPILPTAPATTTVPDQESNCRRRHRYKLTPEDVPEELSKEIDGLRKFYTAPINSKRDAVQFSESTISKLIERTLCFMFFAKEEKNILILSLSLFNSEDLLSDYVTYLSNVRKLMPSTITAILSVAINVVKYNRRDEPNRSQTSPEIIGYRRLQRQLSRQARILSKRAKEGLTSKSSQQFYFAHILEVLRNLHTKQLETHGVVKARFLHDFVLIATYLRAMPGRTSEIRSLKLFIASEQKPSVDLNGNTTENFIVFEDDGRVFLIQNNYKTAQSQGPIRLDISDDLDLLRYLNMYRECRPKLMQWKSHDNFFVNGHGDAFSSSSAVSKYLGDLFEREVSIRVGTNKLRHSIVTYFLSIDQSKDISIRESLAALMKHSVRYQSTVYNDTTQDEKTRKGRIVMRDALTSEVFGDVSADENLSENENLSEDDEIEIRPRVNDICALLDPASTADDILFFIAKIARYTPDGEEAHLIYLEPVENSENLYRVRPGKVWRESSYCLIFPIDIVYNSSENAYELRTTAQDIYKFVKGN